MKEVLTSAIFPFVNDNSFRSFFQSITEGIIIADKHGKILLTNKSADCMFGYTDDGLIGRLVEDLVPSEYGESHKKHRDKYVANPQSRTKRDLEGMKKDGSRFPVEVSLSYIKTENEVFITMFVSDITSRKQAELNANRAKGTASQYFDVAEVILMVLNLKGDIVEINRKGLEVLEYSDVELIGKSWFEICLERPKAEPIKKVFDGVLKENEKYQTHDNYILTKSGSKKLIHWQNTVVRNADGEIVGTLSSGTDITERNLMLKALEESEAKLKAYSVDLEGQVAQRTKELEEALAGERELGELKSKFVSLASHEFRTPLSAILSSASLISRYTTEELNDKRLKHVNRIKSSVTHLTEILDDFLSVDKLDEGDITCRPEKFDLKELFEEVRSSLQEIRKAGQTLVFECNGDVPMLFTDKKLVRNILINLTSNAIKYSPENKPVHVTAQLTKNDILCRIKDEGIGIPEQDQKHLFERFFRAGNAQTFQGTGLGLSIVKRYVELLRGEVSFESYNGKGTTFSIKFPINY